MLQAKQGAAAIQADPKIRLTEQHCNATKDMRPLFSDFNKLSGKYIAALRALNDIGIEMSVLAEKIASVDPAGAYGGAIRDFGSLNRAMEAERTSLLGVWNDAVVTTTSRCSAACDKDAKEFAKSYGMLRSKGTQNLGKMSKEVDKAAKRVKKQGQKPLDDSVERLTQAIQDHDTFLGDQLRKATLMRKTYWCEMVSMVQKIATAQVGVCKKGLEFQEKLSGWASLAQTAEQTDSDVEKVIESSKPTEATSRLAKVRQTGYYNANEFKFLLEEGGGGDEPPLPDRDYEDDGGGASARPEPSTDPKGMVRATKSYTAQNDQELSFSVGDFFTLFDDTTGDLWYGEAQGVRGYFPSSFVSKMRKAGGG